MSTLTPTMDGAKFIIKYSNNIISIEYFNGKNVEFTFTGLDSSKAKIFVEWLVSSAAAFHKIPLEQTTIKTIISESEHD